MNKNNMLSLKNKKTRVTKEKKKKNTNFSLVEKSCHYILDRCVTNDSKKDLITISKNNL